MCVNECFSRLCACVRACRRGSGSGLAGAYVFGIISRYRLAALWPFPSRVPGEEGGFQQGSPLLPSFPRASCWPSPSYERRWRRSDATCETRKSTPKSTAGSQREVSLLAPLGLPPAAWAPGCMVATQSWVFDSQGAEFKAWGRRACVGATWQDSHSVAITGEANMSPGPGGTQVASMSCLVLLVVVLSAHLGIINLELNSVFLAYSAR